MPKNMELNRTNQKAAYWLCKSLGICVDCHSRDAIPGKTHCPECNARDREREAKRRQERRENRKCQECGAPVPAGQYRCQQCRSAHNASNAARMARLKAEGRCIDCGGLKRKGDGVRCWACNLYRNQLKSGAQTAPRDPVRRNRKEDWYGR